MDDYLGSLILTRSYSLKLRNAEYISNRRTQYYLGKRNTDGRSKTLHVTLHAMQRKRHPTTATTDTKGRQLKKIPKGIILKERPHQIGREADQTSRPPKTPKPDHERGQSFYTSHFRVLSLHTNYLLPMQRDNGKAGKTACKGRPPLHRFLLPLKDRKRTRKPRLRTSPNLRLYRPPIKESIKAP